MSRSRRAASNQDTSRDRLFRSEDGKHVNAQYLDAALKAFSAASGDDGPRDDYASHDADAELHGLRRFALI